MKKITFVLFLLLVILLIFGCTNSQQGTSSFVLGTPFWVDGTDSGKFPSNTTYHTDNNFVLIKVRGISNACKDFIAADAPEVKCPFEGKIKVVLDVSAANSVSESWQNEKVTLINDYSSPLNLNKKLINYYIIELLDIDSTNQRAKIVVTQTETPQEPFVWFSHELLKRGLNEWDAYEISTEYSVTNWFKSKGIEIHNFVSNKDKNEIAVFIAKEDLNKMQSLDWVNMGKIVCPTERSTCPDGHPVSHSQPFCEYVCGQQ